LENIIYNKYYFNDIYSLKIKNMKYKKPKVSVILASYKHHLWVGEAIESVLKQTFNDLELIIVDDGSNDGSASIIREYAKKDSRIKYEIFPENKGAISAMKRCYDLCSADYLALISSDDVWELQKLEKQVAILDKNKNIGVVFGIPTFIDQKGNPIKSDIIKVFLNSLEKRDKYQWANYFFNKGNCLCHPSMVIRKECYMEVGFYNSTLRSLPDFDMWVRLFWKYDVEVLEDILIKFRLHTFNESGRLNISSDIRSQTEYKQILNNFLNQIKTIKDLEDVFPEYIEIFKIKNNLLVRFYIAKIALKRNIDFYNDFAFDVLYSEMAKPDVLELIEKNKLYSLQQLANDISSADIYKRRDAKNIKTFIKIPLILKIEKIKSPEIYYFIFSILFIKVIEIKKTQKKNSLKIFNMRTFIKK